MNEYVPSPRELVADQVRRYEASGGAEGNDTAGYRCVIVTHRGRKTGATRKTPLIRVTDGDRYLLVASMGGAPTNPEWVHNLLADGDVTLQDRDRVMAMGARLVEDPAERARLWQVAVAAFPNYAQYQQRTTRTIPVFLLEPRKRAADRRA